MNMDQSWYQQSKDDSQIESMLQELEVYASDLSQALDSFHSDRYDALQRQKQAIANYDKEMQDIEEMEYYGTQRWAAMTDIRYKFSHQ